MSVSRTHPPTRASAAPPPRKPTRTALKHELRNLARAFADELMEVLERSGMWEQTELEAPEVVSKRVRRSLDALHELKEEILARMRAHKAPVAISDIAVELSMTSREVAHPIALLVGEGKVIKTGTRRGTRYHVVRPRTRHPPPSRHARARRRAASRAKK